MSAPDADVPGSYAAPSVASQSAVVGPRYVPTAEQDQSSTNLYVDADRVDEAEDAFRRESEISFRGDCDTYLPLQGAATTIYADDEFAPAPSRTGTTNLLRPPRVRNLRNPPSTFPTPANDAGYMCVVDAPPSLLDTAPYSNPQVLLYAGIDDQLTGIAGRVNPLYSSRASSMTTVLRPMSLF